MSSIKQVSTASNFLPCGEPIVMHPAVLDTLEEIEATRTQVAAEPVEVTLISVVYRPECELDLFLFTLSDGRRLSVPRENLQALRGSTQESAGDFVVGPFGTDVWWTTLDEGVTLDGLLEGRYGNELWMRNLRRPEPIAA